jgi:hypothetical protein
MVEEVKLRIVAPAVDHYCRYESRVCGGVAESAMPPTARAGGMLRVRIGTLAAS